MNTPVTRRPEPPEPFRPNPFGLPEALVGIAAGFVLATVFTTVFATASHHPDHPSGYGSDVASLIGLWIGLVGSAIVASRRAARGPGATGGATTASASARPPGTLALLRRDYGAAIRPWPDVPLGIVAGLVSQYLLVYVFELPLLPFVHHLYSRLSQPAISLTGDAHGAGLVVLGVLVCLGSPLVEELYFRGLLLRSTAGWLGRLGPALGPVASIVFVGCLFGLAHFEALEFPALAGFGMVLCVLAWRTGRLGPGIVAHVTFNTAAFISVARSH